MTAADLIRHNRHSVIREGAAMAEAGAASRPATWVSTAMVRITQLRTEAERLPMDKKAPGDGRAVEMYLREAEAALDRPTTWRARLRAWWFGTDIEQTWRNLHAAEQLVLLDLPESALEERLPG